MVKVLDTITELPELLLVDKPEGISSFDVIRIIQKHFGKIKIGHTGTLDPLANGLMILGTGKGTKDLTSLTGLSKVYVADIILGKSTTTGDREGALVAQKEYPELNNKKVDEQVSSLTDISELPVSLYSALKKDGKPLYKYAREGIVVDNPIKPMRVLQVTLLDHYKQYEFEIVRVLFHVSKGTYIRSLAEELGRRLLVPASLFSLRRTRVGDYKVEDAYSIPDRWLQDFKKGRKNKV
jgi:tRNA pseudouridine55 synthase